MFWYVSPLYGLLGSALRAVGGLLKLVDDKGYDAAKAQIKPDVLAASILEGAGAGLAFYYIAGDASVVALTQTIPLLGDLLGNPATPAGVLAVGFVANDLLDTLVGLVTNYFNRQNIPAPTAK